MELGNIMFNTSNQNQVFDCPDFVIALLRDIERKIEILYWNKHQEEWESAFGNTGNSYKGACFEVSAFNWDDDIDQLYNFKYGNVEISWYKYLGRDTTINIDPKSKAFKEKMIEMYNQILQELDESENEDL